jgi:hypothetical protein
MVPPFSCLAQSAVFSKIDGTALYFPVAEACGIRAAATAYLPGHCGFLRGLPPFLGFLQGPQCRRRQLALAMSGVCVIIGLCRQIFLFHRLF